MDVDGTRTNHSRLTPRMSLPASRRPASAARNPGSGYLGDIRRFSILEKELEYRLAKRWREHGDRKAADQIVTSHLRLAAKIAMNYRGYGPPISEIISEGNLGLMQAINRFDPERGFRFATYAVWWIRASIQDYILRSWSLVKIGTTANQKKLFFKLRSAIRDEENSGEWLDYLVDEGPSPEAIVVEHDEMDHRHEALVRAVGVLNHRERHIFEARHLVDEPKTLEDLAIEFKVSRERVRQIEVRAFEKVQAATKRSIRERRARVALHA